ncbi:MAG: hypothetical protein HWE18_10435 [Gammaproteobacteria bacterium]|nr:hypothetical protein [Gammaproteobacteria bacterium]
MKLAKIILFDFIFLTIVINALLSWITLPSNIDLSITWLVQDLVINTIIMIFIMSLLITYTAGMLPRRKGVEKIELIFSERLTVYIRKFGMNSHWLRLILLVPMLIIVSLILLKMMLLFLEDQIDPNTLLWYRFGFLMVLSLFLPPVIVMHRLLDINISRFS